MNVRRRRGKGREEETGSEEKEIGSGTCKEYGRREWRGGGRKRIKECLCEGKRGRVKEGVR